MRLSSSWVSGLITGALTALGESPRDASSLTVITLPSCYREYR